MASKDAYPVSSGEIMDDNTRSVIFFSALSHISAQPSGANDLAWHVEHLAGRRDTAEVFKGMHEFNKLHHTQGIDAALESVDLNNAGVPVEVVDYDDGGNHQVYIGKVVALVDRLPSEHGAYKCVAVTDFGEGSEVINVSLRANVPGIVYPIQQQE